MSRLVAVQTKLGLDRSVEDGEPAHARVKKALFACARVGQPK